MRAQRRNGLALSLSLVFMASLVLLGSSCSKKESTTETATNGTPMAQTPAPGAPSDAEIAAIVLAANDADIANGQLAQSKTGNSEVKSFGTMMVTDHSSVNDKAKALATQLNLTPQEGETSRSIKATQDSMRTMLQVVKMLP